MTVIELLKSITRPVENEICPQWWIKENILDYVDQALALLERLNGFPEIVCLCGSTKFYEQFMETNYKLSMQGKIVLSVGFFMHRPDTQHGEICGCTKKQKKEQDRLHLRKIDLADSVLILNVGGYIGESTRNEIEYAESKGKPIGYLESCGAADDI